MKRYKALFTLEFDADSDKDAKESIDSLLSTWELSEENAKKIRLDLYELRHLLGDKYVGGGKLIPN
jgi:hypothetical protein